MRYHEAMVKAEEALAELLQRVRVRPPQKARRRRPKPVLLKGETPPLHELLTQERR